MISRCIFAALFTFVGWLLPRVVAGTRGRKLAWWLFDAALPIACVILLIAITARPLSSGVLVFLLCAGYAYADRAKRRVLAEPIVATDVFQAFDIFRHPRLALPFPNKERVVLGALAAVALIAAMFYAEPALPQWVLWWPVSALLIAVVTIVALVGKIGLALGRWLKHAGLLAEPQRDSAEFGPLAILLAYALIARGERESLQAAVPAPISDARRSPPTGQRGPLVLIQCESFFDARRLHSSLVNLPLPALDRCRENGIQWGRLTVPSWGANTVRTEFAVLSGLPPDAAGFDRFNPYHRFAHAPIVSLAWSMREQGYRTICVHPFDRRFYRRDQVMPNLGFDEFVGEEAFAGAQRKNGFVADIELAYVGSELLKQSIDPVFLFLITMENHGPWKSLLPAERRLLPEVSNLSSQQLEQLESYLQSLRSADAMLAYFEESLSARGDGGVLALYGDHLPSFPSAFESFGLADQRSDYLIWRAGRGERRSFCSDTDANQLATAIMQARLRD